MIIPIELSEKSYDIVLEAGVLGRVSEHLNLNRKVLIVTDNGVPKEYAETVRQAVTAQNGYPLVATVCQGEGSKSLGVFEDLLKKMLDYGFTRSDCVVAVGGGVVGDLAGFVAASYMRGVDFYNIPTTLLSQVDSSIGGKVAVNLGNIKNIVGAFYQPKKVVIDPKLLNTLTKREFLSGLAESIKMAATADAKLFELIEKEDPWENITEIIEGSLKIKKYFVENDEKEQNIRKVLNFGHTIGHAIESQSTLLAGDGKALYHGECVALGMLYMCDGAVRERIVNVLKKVGLPYSHGYTDLYEAALHDKKADAKNITIIYVPEIGKYDLRTIPKEELKEYLK